MVVRRGAVAWVLLPKDDEVELFDHRKAVRVVLSTGETLDGSLLYSAPAEHARMVDHLNEPRRFLDLWRDERLCLVNKAYVVKLTER
jgi:hypothetical protein